MDQHFKSSNQPLFVYVQTMASHGPYNSAYMPEENVPGGGPGTSAEMSEFLRREAMAQRDGDFFMDELKRRFPDEPILVVRYGDHQPSATYDLIDRTWGDDSPDIGEGGKPGPYITYYAMLGHNYPLPPLPAFDPLDIAYLGTVMLEVAGLTALRRPAGAEAADGGLSWPLFRLRTPQRYPRLPSAPDQFGPGRGAIAKLRASGHEVFGREFEAGEVEAGRHGAAEQRPCAKASRGLPGAGRHDALRVLAGEKVRP